jgi:hypothetical protein
VMGEAGEWLFEPEFNRAIKVCDQDQRIASDAGVFLLQEADHRLGLVSSLAAEMIDPRIPAKIRYTLVELLRERLYVLGRCSKMPLKLNRSAEVICALHCSMSVSSRFPKLLRAVSSNDPIMASHGHSLENVVRRGRRCLLHKGQQKSAKHKHSCVGRDS